MPNDDGVPRAVREALGGARADLQEGRTLAKKAAEQGREKQPSLADIDEDIADEISKVTQEAVRAELERDRLARQKDPTLSGVHVHVVTPEEKRSLSPPGGTASVRLNNPILGEFGARGPRWLVALAIVAVVVVVLAIVRGKTAAPKAGMPDTSTAPN